VEALVQTYVVGMALVRTRGPRFATWGAALLVVVATAVAGQLEAAELIGGALTVWAAVSLGWILMSRAAIETDPTRVLKLDLLLVVVVLLGLGGVTVIGLAIL